MLIGGFPISPIENYARAFFQKALKPRHSTGSRQRATGFRILDALYSTYDPLNHIAVVTDSYGHDTKYQMNGDNAVVTVTDPLGGVTSYTFDDSYRKMGHSS